MFSLFAKTAGVILKHLNGFDSMADHESTMFATMAILIFIEKLNDQDICINTSAKKTCNLFKYD